MSSPKQQVDSFTMVLFWLMGMLFLRIPNEFLIGKLVSFCLVVGAAFLCFVASQQEERLVYNP